MEAGVLVLNQVQVTKGTDRAELPGAGAVPEKSLEAIEQVGFVLLIVIYFYLFIWLHWVCIVACRL